MNSQNEVNEANGHNGLGGKALRAGENTPGDAIQVSEEIHGSGDGHKPGRSNPQLPQDPSDDDSEGEEEESYDSESGEDDERTDSAEEDSDDSSEAEVPSKSHFDDFFEGNALLTCNELLEYPLFTPHFMYLEYQQTFLEIQKLVEEVPNEFKYEISALLYPMLVLGYLQMVVGGDHKMAKRFLEENEDYLEDIYDRSIAKLRRIRRPQQVPGRALELLLRRDLVRIEMSQAASIKFGEYRAKWPLDQQNVFIGHIAIDGLDTAPQERLPLRRPPLEVIRWADLTHSVRRSLHLEPCDQQLSSCFLRPPLLNESEEVIGAVLFKDGCWVAIAIDYFAIRLVEVKLTESVTVLSVLTGHTGKIVTGDISPDRRFLVTCSQDGTIRLWCLVLHMCAGIYTQQSPVRSVVFAPVIDYFAAACEDGLARVWIKSCAEPILRISGHLAELEVCLYHPNSRYLATGSADLTVRMWDVASRGEQVRLFFGHKAPISALAFSRSGRYLISGGLDHMFIIWDTTDERPIRSLSYHSAPISTIDFALDDSRLAVGCRGTYLSIWNFENILKPDQHRERILILSHPNAAGPILQSRFVSLGHLISICGRQPRTSAPKNRARK
ncbi:transcription initiation factor TFIID subunit 5-like [Drosophila miranda]|uniref:transcription initiation factor TFIID subunit 5-like n=1 Tax=Drosophila miranda TaxID=7229 RepID=UPI0007E74785|nr:transcription initiation factor TFIID subunit 5-like [Drosophila miranda]